MCLPPPDCSMFPSLPMVWSNIWPAFWNCAPCSHTRKQTNTYTENDQPVVLPRTVFAYQCTSWHHTHMICTQTRESCFTIFDSKSFCAFTSWLISIDT